MSVFEDHLPCPALHRWLLPSWDGQAVAWWTAPGASGWSPPRGVRRLVSSVEALSAEAPPASLDVLVVLSPLPDPAPMLEDAVWGALRPGGILVELATPRRRSAKELLRPWAHTRRLRESTALRVRHWL